MATDPQEIPELEPFEPDEIDDNPVLNPSSRAAHAAGRTPTRGRAVPGGRLCLSACCYGVARSPWSVRAAPWSHRPPQHG